MKATRDERFQAKINRTDTCWLWTGAVSTWGYGYFSYSHDRQVYAHRYAYEVAIGPIPPGLTIDHLCRVRHCVNPAHLEAVTMRENTLRGDTLQAMNARKTHCHRGHSFDEANTGFTVRPNGYVQRRCRTCDRERQRRYRSLNA